MGRRGVGEPSGSSPSVPPCAACDHGTTRDRSRAIAAETDDAAGTGDTDQVAEVDRPTATRTPWLWRSADRRVVAGVAGGISERLGVDVIAVRAAIIALVPAGGAGVFAYLLAWTLAEQEPPEDVTVRPRSPRRDLAVGFLVTGVLLLARAVGFWLGDEIVWPVALVALGSAVIWTRTDEADWAPWTRLADAAIGGEEHASRTAVVRLILGGALVVAGMGAFLAASDAVNVSVGAVVAVIITGLGVSLILGPWIVRQAQQLTEERRERIRSQERAEVAAHLHDSVLQTLAMIQRSESPRRMVSLARGQERELRTWLYGGGEASDAADRLEGLMEEVAGRVEQLYELPVELVVVGDAAVDDRVRALAKACYEAAQNAAQHSGAEGVSMYVEVESHAVTAFVRDEGKGFDADAVPDDRRGIADSIVGRLRRHGGTVQIRSEIGAGTEIELQLSREH